MPKINLIHGDCMEYMATLKDKAFDLAIVDPPYGVNIGQVVGGVNRLVRQVKIGGEKLSCPKHIGVLMTPKSPKKNILWS
jgi:DNA modification methylase